MYIFRLNFLNKYGSEGENGVEAGQMEGSLLKPSLAEDAVQYVRELLYTTLHNIPYYLYVIPYIYWYYTGI